MSCGGASCAGSLKFSGAGSTKPSNLRTRLSCTHPVLAFPFKVACQHMLLAGTGLGALRAAVKMYYDYTGQEGQCFDFDILVVKEAARHWK